MDEVDTFTIDAIDYYTSNNFFIVVEQLTNKTRFFPVNRILEITVEKIN